MLNSTVHDVTQRIVARSENARQRFLARTQQQAQQTRARHRLSCANFAHVIAASDGDKAQLMQAEIPHLGIVTAYNDMLSAHQPYEQYPAQIKAAARDVNATAQVAGGVPAMCDGVTQGRAGMELSLFSRDVIALSTAVALSHDAFDAVVLLGVCDKIAPGLLMGALQFAHLPIGFIPAGPMPSGLPNKEKVRVRQNYAQGKASKDELLHAECASYHSAGTCTFYGTANSNQLVLETMGLQLPGSSFEPPHSELRRALTDRAVHEMIRAARQQPRPRLADIVTEKSIVNAIVALLASGGSTNHTLHLVAMARAAGIHITWDDMAQLSTVVPLLCRIYPNGEDDVNAFHQAGGMGFFIRELLRIGVLHNDVKTILGDGLEAFTATPEVQRDLLGGTATRMHYRATSTQSGSDAVLRAADNAFQPTGGLQVLHGNLGQSVIKTSAVKSEFHHVRAPARVFTEQQQVKDAFKNGELNRDVVAVLRFQGPQANGMPELHELTPILGSLQDHGFRVAIVTDGRMSGASGKVPAAIHVTPEAKQGGAIAKVRDGDIIELDAQHGTLNVLVDETEWQSRVAATMPARDEDSCGRHLFTVFRQMVASADHGASVFECNESTLP